MRTRFIINQASGPRARAVTGTIREVLASEEGFFEIRLARSREETLALSRDAVSKGYGLVVACGGDGTVNDVATGLVGSQTALGVIPTGSGNGFARSLSIPLNVKEAVSLIKRPVFREIDAGRIAGRYFFSTAGFGLDARISERYARGTLSRRMRGILPYYPIALVEYLGYRPSPVVVKADGFTATVNPLLITAANTERYGGAAVIAPGAVPDDGLLDICIVEKAGFFKDVAAGMKLKKGRIASHAGYRPVKAARAEISGAGKSSLHADGEPFSAEGEIIIEAVPKAIKVLAP